MASGLGRHGTAAVITSTPISLATALGVSDPQLKKVRFVSIQPFGANAAIIYVGFNQDTLSSTNYWMRLELPVSTIPSAPFFLDDVQFPGISLDDIQILGTTNDKLSVGWIPYI